MNIVLTGFMASGKTEISKAVSRISGYKAIDTDEMIEKAAGKSINEIFAQMGEAEFRRIEYETICRAAELDGYVIATGGGVPLNSDNIALLRKNGVIVNLAPDFEVIKSRLEAARAARPLLRDQSIAEIKQRFEDRKPYYANCDIVLSVTGGKTPELYAAEILEAIKNKRERYGQ